MKKADRIIAEVRALETLDLRGLRGGLVVPDTIPLIVSRTTLDWIPPGPAPRVGEGLTGAARSIIVIGSHGAGSRRPRIRKKLFRAVDAGGGEW